MCKCLCGLCKSNKEYHMLDEIMEQKKVFKNLCSIYFDENKNLNLNDFPIDNWNRIVICASGSSKHVAEISKYTIEQFAKIPCSIEYSSEFAHKDNVLGDRDLFIAISQSGNTADTFEALKKAKQAGAKTFAITNCADSKIHTNADYKILADAGIEQSIAATKSVAAQLLVLYIFAIGLAERVKNQDCSAFKNDLYDLADKYDEVFAQRDNIKKITKITKKAKSIAVLGRNINSALAQEASLKIKETCYINANSAPAGEFMHGHFAFLDKQVPVICFLNKCDEDKENYDLAVHNVQEVQSKRKVNLIVFKTKGDEELLTKVSSKSVIEIPKVNKFLVPFLDLAAVQLLAYETAKLLHDNIDEPRDLTKCVASE